MNKGWIRLYRNIQEWEWKKSSKHVAVFLDILLEANHVARRYKGVDIPSGSLTTSLKAISDRTGVSVRSVRTILNDLKSTQEVTIKTTSKYTMISITNWLEYQSGDTVNDKQVTNERQTNDKQVTNERQLTRIKELRIKELRIKKEDIVESKHKCFVDSWNSIVRLPKIITLTEKRKRLIDQAISRGVDKEKFEVLLNIVNQSDFLNGINDRGWKASFDFIMKEETQVKILEGVYNSRTNSKAQVKQDTTLNMVNPYE